ncbi:MAG: hypothetical protein K2Q10_10290, partial [Rhodospirillales bacterium]|nr:hypothetical protein [Rhodospirillales bacterium]
GGAAGHPEIGADIAEAPLDHCLAARGTDEEAGAIAAMEDSIPERPFVDAKAGLVGFNHAARQQPLLDPVGRGVKMCICPGQ